MPYPLRHRATYEPDSVMEFGFYKMNVFKEFIDFADEA